MHIGELAAKATVNIQTIRFYEREGLLPVPSRNNSGYRCYGPSDLERVTFIKRNQELGFTLGEIMQLLDLHRVVAAMPLPLHRKPSELRGIIALGHERLDVINEKIRARSTPFVAGSRRCCDNSNPQPSQPAPPQNLCARSRQISAGLLNGVSAAQELSIRACGIIGLTP